MMLAPAHEADMTAPLHAVSPRFHAVQHRVALAHLHAAAQRLVLQHVLSHQQLAHFAPVQRRTQQNRLRPRRGSNPQLFWRAQRLFVHLVQLGQLAKRRIVRVPLVAQSVKP